MKRNPKLGSKTSLTFLGYISVLGLYNTIGGRVRKEEEDEILVLDMQFLKKLRRESKFKK